MSEAGWRLDIGPVNSQRIGCIGFVGGRMILAMLCTPDIGERNDFVDHLIVAMWW